LNPEVWAGGEMNPRNKPEVDHLLPDFRLALSNRVSADDIDYLKFYGPHLGRFKNNPIIVRDRGQVKRILAALRHAFTRSMQLANRINIMEIHFKGKPGKEKEPVTLNFNALSAPDCYGPEFQLATQDVLHILHLPHPRQ
jgi:hypothetical protein